MPTIIFLLIGVAAAVALWIETSHYYGGPALALVLIAAYFWLQWRKRRYLSDPENRRKWEAERKRLERKLGVPLPYNAALPDGRPAEATITRMVGMHEMTSDDNPKVEFHLEVRPAFGEPYSAVIRGAVPLILLPQFQPGKIFSMRYDADDPQRIVFYSFTAESGQEILLSDYPA